MDELKKVRLEKLKRIKSAGLNAYPGKVKRTHKISEALDKFSYLARIKKEIILAGRIRSLRIHGGATFLHFEDGTGRLQALLRKDKLGENGYKFFLDNFDIGDFIEIKGYLIKTKKGEKTIEASNFKMLAKSLLPLPEKWHGLKDVEERFRKRYLDLIFNLDVKKKFEIRSKILREIRNFLDSEGFLEVETPILQTLYGGAKARPFKTHLNALDLDLYLRIAPELYLKRLLVGGFEKIYEIGKCFRNEGIDKYHNPDFTTLELYWAYADYKDLMKLIERLFLNLIRKVFRKRKIKYQGQEIDFKIPWQRVEFSDLLKKYAGINYEEFNRERILKRAKELEIEISEAASKAEIADEIFKKICRPKIIQPTFVIHYPVGFQPLAKKLDENPEKIANLQLVIAGIEFINGYSELNDPTEQRERLEEQEKMFKAGFEEAQRSDEEFLEALEYGMPPATGLGLGIDRLVILLTDSSSLREVVLFPILRPKWE
ncbi:lysyl-tRNA synthetase [Parcubacteria bacterium DG_74_2]|nr:MAG: lysyl-tRNA synthetase [Parcubacteria bacterium DG_74_2]